MISLLVNSRWVYQLSMFDGTIQQYNRVFLHVTVMVYEQVCFFVSGSPVNGQSYSLLIIN